MLNSLNNLKQTSPAPAGFVSKKIIYGLYTKKYKY